MQTSSATDDPLALFERHRPRLFGLAYRMLGQRADAEDLVRRPGCAGMAPSAPA